VPGDFVPASSIRADGQRNYVYPADVRGRFTRARRILFIFLILVFIALPLLPIGGHPAVFLDIEQRRFYLFGLTYNAQDLFLLFFLLSGLGFGLFVVTALLGRVWCGYTCPQTVFLEGVYMRVERWIEGPRSARMRRNAGPWNFDKIWRKTLEHALFIAISIGVVHVILAFFVSWSRLAAMTTRSPAEHPVAFGFMVVVTGLTYFNFAWFREQVCLIICPYGRLQSLLTDDDSLIVGYDEKRGEPRGKKSDPEAGDCIDCKRCVVVCPTGIDIRNGLQIDCIACAACIDACDEVMKKVGREPGLVRYDSLNGLAGKPRRLWRPRIALYAVLGIIGLGAATMGFRSHQPYEANFLRLRGAPYTFEKGEIRNAFELHLVNKRGSTVTFDLKPEEQSGIRYVIPKREVTLESMASARIPVFALLAQDALRPGLKVEVSIEPRTGDLPSRTVSAPFAGPM